MRNTMYCANLEKWGEYETSNTLYITGVSGSGKSTLALSFKRENDVVVHLDAYAEPDMKDCAQLRNVALNKYLDDKVPLWRYMSNATKSKDSVIRRHSKEYWNIVDKFQKAIEDYAKDLFANGQRVIVEGVQIADGWYAGSPEYYVGQPVITLAANPFIAYWRATVRDGKKLFQGVRHMKEYVQWYWSMSKKVKKLRETVILREVVSARNM